ncbi:MAG: hypothetical protein GY753_02445 [Gammaproteobacteria bacterium]|nr:hypothetical protein [Gammaproteobacteria bacterium]
MSAHTIQLTNPQGPINVILRGNTITIDGVQYRLSVADLTRLSIWTDDNVKAVNRKPYRLSDDDRVAIHEYVTGG